MIKEDNNLKNMATKRVLGDLKTPQSLRDVPLHPRLKRLLLKIKANRILEYKQCDKILNEDELNDLMERNFSLGEISGENLLSNKFKDKKST